MKLQMEEKVRKMEASERTKMQKLSDPKVMKSTKISFLLQNMNFVLMEYEYISFNRFKLADLVIEICDVRYDTPEQLIQL